MEEFLSMRARCTTMDKVKDLQLCRCINYVCEESVTWSRDEDSNAGHTRQNNST